MTNNDTNIQDNDLEQLIDQNGAYKDILTGYYVDVSDHIVTIDWDSTAGAYIKRLPFDDGDNDTHIQPDELTPYAYTPVPEDAIDNPADWLRRTARDRLSTSRQTVRAGYRYASQMTDIVDREERDDTDDDDGATITLHYGDTADVPTTEHTVTISNVASFETTFGAQNTVDVLYTDGTVDEFTGTGLFVTGGTL